MFVGRENELATLERCYRKDSFQMVVLYGRRRVGKTTLLSHFAKGKRTLFYTAQEQSDADNLRDLSERIAEVFSLPKVMFKTWDDALDFLAAKAKEEPFLFIFDEFPYAAQANNALASKMQIAIDHKFSRTSITMVLCGSNQGFMESKVLGKKSPLHGRRTAQIRLGALSYTDAARMLPWASPEDAIAYYCCVGGIPYYLAQIESDLSFRENIATLYFAPSGFLYGEPAMLLRQELREPAIYNSILRALANGANKPSEIADKVGVEATSLSRYLATLKDLQIIEKVFPFGENPETSRKGLWRIGDACYDFWYRFVAPLVADIEAGAGVLAARSIGDQAINTFVGKRFEGVCLQWLLAEALDDKLAVPVTSFGIWWGTDPKTKSQTDIDVLAVNKSEKAALIGECKWRNSLDEAETVEGLLGKSHLLAKYSVEAFYLFTKMPVGEATRRKYEGDVVFVSLEDMLV